jgi:hypothetical protein
MITRLNLANFKPLTNLTGEARQSDVTFRKANTPVIPATALAYVLVNVFRVV